MNAPAQASADMLHLISRDAAGAAIRFGQCATVIRLRATADDKGRIRVSQSHWISPPGGGRRALAEPYTCLSAGQALAAAIGGLSSQFRSGLTRGHVPDESWFVSVPTLVGA